MQQRPVGTVHLLKVRQHIAMGQHCPFRHAGCAAGILKKSEILRDDFRLNVLHAVAVLQRAAKRDGVRQMVFWHQPFDVLHHKVNQRPFRRGKLIAHAG